MSLGEVVQVGSFLRHFAMVSLLQPQVHALSLMAISTLYFC